MIYALIFAGGIGQRMNSVALPKQFLKVHGKEIIIHTIERFQECDAVDKIVVVCIEGYIQHLEELVKKYRLTKVITIVSGGHTGQESIYKGLVEVKKDSIDLDDIVLIHDGVRPIITNDTIYDNINSVKKYGNAITVSKAFESVMLVDGDKEVKRTLNRNNCYLGRAPQSFRVKDIYDAHLKAISENKNDFTDSASLMSYYGYQLYTIIGPQNNIKVTTPMDFYFFRAILDYKESEQINDL